MKLRTLKSLVVVSVAAALTFAVYSQQRNDNPEGTFDLSWNTVDGGGGTSTGNGFELSGTIGQPDASPQTMSGGGYEIVGGFWAGLDAIPLPDTCPADINNDGLVNVSDLLAVISGWGNCPVPPASCPADVNNDSVVNVSDLLAVISGWGVCPP